MFTDLSNIIKVSTVTVREITSMALKDFGAILKEDWLPKVVSGKNGCPFTWLNMSGVTTIEMLALKLKRNSL